MAFIIGLPVVQIIIFCLAIGHDPKGLNMAITNFEMDDTQLMNQDCPVIDGCNHTYLSCRYMNYLINRSVIAVSFSKDCGKVPRLLTIFKDY